MKQFNIQSVPAELHSLRRAAIAAALFSNGTPLANDSANLEPGAVALTNDSLLRTTEPVTELTLFAAGYTSMRGAGLQRLRDFLAPPRPTQSRIFRLTSWNENEPWYTVDYTKVKRGILADFPEIRQQTATKTDLQGFNRGLSVVIDRDELKNKPELQQQHTKWLIDMLMLASVLETMALYQSSAITTGITWDSAANPDLSLRNIILALANVTGFYPTNVGYGDAAHLKRANSYESQLTAGSIARAGQYTEGEIATAVGVANVLVNAERYQVSAAAKQEIIGQAVLLFTALLDAGPFDASNIVRHVFNGVFGGGEYAIYLNEYGPKKLVLTAENYELIHAQHTTGIEYVNIN